ncbi:MAG: hypothetical protein ACLP4V_32000 [Methylocella sp.]
MILTKMGPASAAREQELAKIAARLSAANSPGEIARALDDFLDLVQDTPACDYVRQLIARSQIQEEKVKGDFVAVPAEMGDVTVLQKTSTMTSQALGRAAVAEHEPNGVEVFFATNRKCDEKQPPDKRFSAELTNTLTLGLAKVTIPIAKHQEGTLETPAWWNRFADAKDASCGSGANFQDQCNETLGNIMRLMRRVLRSRFLARFCH